MALMAVSVRPKAVIITIGLGLLEALDKSLPAPDDEAVSRAAIGQCLIDTELAYGDPGRYCFHHFYPFAC
jgi:hypothetical protein